MQEPRKSTFLIGATFKAKAPFLKGKELNPHCTRHLCPYEVDKDGNGVCKLGCAWMRKGEQR